jgi:hypothetical protein
MDDFSLQAQIFLGLYQQNMELIKQTMTAVGNQT